MTVEKPKPKQLLRPITTGANSALNQSQFLAIIWNLLKTLEKSRVHGATGFGFAYHWLKNWRDSFKPITKCSNRNHVITFDSHLKTALIYTPLLVIASVSTSIDFILTAIQSKVNKSISWMNSSFYFLAKQKHVHFNAFSALLMLLPYSRNHSCYYYGGTIQTWIVGKRSPTSTLWPPSTISFCKQPRISGNKSWAGFSEMFSFMCGWG